MLKARMLPLMVMAALVFGSCQAIAQCSSDSDCDGMPDSWEVSMGTNPYVADAGADPDSDFVTNYTEYTRGTHPGDSNDGGLDYDSDGLTDYEEIVLGTNKWDADPDHDGLSDPEEVGIGMTPGTGTDPWNSDSDGDGMDDGFEVDNFQSYWWTYASGGRDEDSDGWSNLQEYCLNTNPINVSSHPTGSPGSWTFSNLTCEWGDVGEGGALSWDTGFDDVYQYRVFRKINSGEWEYVSVVYGSPWTDPNDIRACCSPGNNASYKIYAVYNHGSFDVMFGSDEFPGLSW